MGSRVCFVVLTGVVTVRSMRDLVFNLDHTCILALRKMVSSGPASTQTETHSSPSPIHARSTIISPPNFVSFLA